MKFFKNFKRRNKTERSALERKSVPSVGESGLARGALLAAKPKKTLLSLLAAVLCCTCATVIGLTTNLFASAASTAGDGNTSTIVLTSGNTIYKNNLAGLYRYIGGSSVNTITLLSNKVKTSSVSYTSVNSHYGWSSQKIRSNSAYGNYNTKVSFGGYEWLVTYVSFDSSNNLIATLMMADSNALGTVAFGGYSSTTAANQYVSNIYSSSLVRSYLVGSTYATGASTCTAVSSGNATLKTFLSSYSKYLVAPSKISWQQGIQGRHTGGLTYTMANECWDVPIGATNYVNANSNMYNGTNAKANINDWKNDLIWLPAAAEIGQANANPGLWETDVNMRKATYKYWTRTGTQNTSTKYSKVKTTAAAGGSFTDTSVTSSGFYVRPCVHLNLTALNGAANSTEPAKPYWTTSQSNYYRFSSNILYGSYTGVAQTATMYYPSHVSSPSTTYFSSTISGTTRTFTPSSASVTVDTSPSSSGESHDYKCTYLYPSSGYFWSDGTTSYEYYSIKLYRAVINIGFNATTFKYDGSAHAPTISSITANSASASKVNKPLAAGNVYLPSASNFSVVGYYGTKANGTAWGSSSSLYTSAPTDVGTYYVKLRLNNGSSSTNNASSYRTNFTLNESYAAPTVATGTNTYDAFYQFVINYGDITTYSATALSGTYSGAAQNLITAHSATTNTTQTWTYSTTSSTSGFSSTIPKATNAGTYTVWCKVTAPYYNDRVFSKSATIAKKDISSGVSWSAWGTYTYSGAAHSPTPTVTAVGTNSVTSSSTNDFSYTYSSNINAGTATVKISAKSTSTNYTGSVSRTFSIAKKDISSGVTWSTISAFTYSGGAKTPTPTVTKVGSNSVTSSAVNDFSYTYSNNTNAGTATVKISAKSTSTNYTGSASQTFSISKKDISSGVTWSTISAFTYSGGAKTPTPTVTKIGSNSVTSSSTSDFSYTYSNNVNAGTATVKVTAKTTSTNYTGGAVSLTFTINKAEITGVIWETLSLTYTGAEQCPVLKDFTAGTTVIDGARPLNIFEVTGGQTDAGTYTVKAIFKPESTANFTSFSTEYTASYTIKKAVIEMMFTTVMPGIEYDGTAKSTDVTIKVPETVIKSARPTIESFDISFKAKSGSHLTGGLAVDAGEYIENLKLVREYAKNFTLSSDSQTVTEVDCWFVIAPRVIVLNWSTNQSAFTYNGLKQGPEIVSFGNIPETGSDPFEGFETTYYSGNTALISKPVHAGSYKVAVELINPNYAISYNQYTLEFVYKNQKTFTITSVKYADNADLNWTDATGLIFTGKPQGPYLSADLLGAFAGADDNRALDITLTYKTAAGKVLDGKPVNAGSYVMSAVESFGDYTFDDVSFEIARREVTVVWKGDSQSKLTDGVLQWLYDGKEHKPDYTIDFGGIEIFRGDKKVETLKLDYASRTAVGSQTAVAVLAQDPDADGTDYNANFVIATDCPQCEFEILKFIATYVEWYEYGATEALTKEEINGLSYEYPKVYGEDGPKLSSYACTVFHADEGDVEIKIALNVTYPTSFTKYWWNGKEEKDPYEAIALFYSKDSANCEFDSSLLKEAADGTDKVFITFFVTDIRTDIAKATVIWTVGGVDINQIGTLEENLANGIDYGWVGDVFTFVYNATAQYPVPKAFDEHGRPIAVKVLPSGIKTDVGVYSAILAPLASYEVSLADSECVYAITAREITLKWDENAEFVYNGTEQYPTATVESGTLLEGHSPAYSVDGVNAGMHTVTASVLNADKTVNTNYIIKNSTTTVKITPKPVSANDIEWTANGAVGDFVWNYDGQPHCPDAKLFTTVNENKVELKLSVMGGATAAGSYVAYAILNPADPNSRNFTLVESETNPVAAVARREFEITRITLTEIKWFAEENGDEAEEIVYIYNGLERLPVAVGYTADGTAIALNVFGGRTDVGKYTATVTDDYGLATGVEKSKDFTIQPKPVTLVWQEGDENGEIHFTYDGTVKRPSVTIDGLTEDDYAVNGFVNAGSYVTEVTFLNANYTADGDNSCGFIIDKAVVKLSWTGVGNYTPSDAEDGVLYWRYNAQSHGPVASGKFDTVIFGANSEYRIIISEQETSAGRYTAYAVLDYSFAGNANFVLDNAEKTYVITPYELRVNWTGNVTDYEEGDAGYGKIFRWTYDGATAFAPTAKYTLWDGTEVVAEVHGARVNAGADYVASVSLPENCVFAIVNGKSCGNQTFEVLKCQIEKIIWLDALEGEDITFVKNFAYSYNGLSHLPVAIVEGTGEELIVTGARINAGNGYIATAALKDAGNYEFAEGVNYTYTFAIDPMEVWILWVDNSDPDLGAFEWSYSGKFICPEAILSDAEGNPILDNGSQIPVTVTGGRIVAGNNYQATVQNTFTNYKFAADARLIMPFKIKAVSLGENFDWTYDSTTCTKTVEADGSLTFEYTFNGTAQQPFAVCNLSDADVAFAYTIKNSKGETVNAIINAGEYTLSVKSTNGSYSVPVDTVKVVINALTVKAEWGETSLAYDGTQRVPEAWYIDAFGQTVALEVTGGVLTGKGNAIAAMYATDNTAGNYILDADTTEMEFTVAEKHYDDFTWDWTDDNEGEWNKKVTLFADRRKAVSAVEE